MLIPERTLFIIFLFCLSYIFACFNVDLVILALNEVNHFGSTCLFSVHVCISVELIVPERIIAKFVHFVIIHVLFIETAFAG